MWSLFTVMAVLSGLGAVAVVQGAISGSAPEPLTTGQVSSELGTVNAGTPEPRATGPSAHPTPSTSHSGKPKPSPTKTSGAGGATSPSPTTSPRPTKSASPSASGGSSGGSGSSAQTRVLTSRGGSVVASCQAGQVYLRSWSPAAGFAVDEVQRGPADTAEIKFRSTGGQDDEVGMHLSCRSGVPVASNENSRDHD